MGFTERKQDGEIESKMEREKARAGWREKARWRESKMERQQAGERKMERKQDGDGLVVRNDFPPVDAYPASAMIIGELPSLMVTHPKLATLQVDITQPKPPVFEELACALQLALCECKHGVSGELADGPPQLDSMSAVQDFLQRMKCDTRTRLWESVLPALVCLDEASASQYEELKKHVLAIAQHTWWPNAHKVEECTLWWP